MKIIQREPELVSSNSFFASASPVWVLVDPRGYNILVISPAADEYGKNLKLTAAVDEKVTAACFELCAGLCSVSIMCLSASCPFLNSQEPTDPEPSKTITISLVIVRRLAICADSPVGG